MIKMKKIVENKYKKYLQDIKEWSELAEQFKFDIHDIYEIDKKESNKFIQAFRDDSGILNFIKARKNGDMLEIKFYWVDIKGRPTFDKRKTYDPKILSTFLNLFLNYFLSLSNAFILQPMDIYRLRLFRMALNKYLDHEKWDMITNENALKIIIFKKDEYIIKEIIAGIV